MGSFTKQQIRATTRVRTRPRSTSSFLSLLLPSRGLRGGSSPLQRIRQKTWVRWPYSSRLQPSSRFSFNWHLSHRKETVYWL